MTAPGRAGRLLGGLGWLARTALAFGVLLIVYGLTLGDWTNETVSRASAQRERLRAEIRKAEVMAAHMPTFLGELRLLGGRLEQVAALLPEERVAWLPIQLASRADAAAVEGARLSPRAPDASEDRDFVRSARLHVEARGSLPALGRFADSLARLSALGLEAVEIARLDSGAYAARFDVRAWEWIPDARSDPPHCERGETALYAAAELVAAGTRLASRSDEHEGWRRRRAMYRVTRVFKLSPGAGAPDVSRPGSGTTIPVARSCLTPRVPSATTVWPAPIERCPDMASALDPSSNAAHDDQPAAGERLLFLRSGAGATWEPVGRYGLFGTCDAALSAEDDAGYAEVRAWKATRETG
jgi:Tfp pilus assembly protein PilO